VLVVEVADEQQIWRRAEEPRKMPSGPTMTAGKMVRVVKECVKDWKFIAVAGISRADHQRASAARAA